MMINYVLYMLPDKLIEESNDKPITSNIIGLTAVLLITFTLLFTFKIFMNNFHYFDVII